MALKRFYKDSVVEAGCDEAGRGCLAGPVFAAAVILPEKKIKEFSLLNDSKKLSETLRDELRAVIEYNALAWAVASVNEEEIDKMNILNASIKAIHLAIEKLTVLPEHLIIDGNKFKPYKTIPHQCIVKGDGKYLSIAAASILAKTHRDEYVMKMHNEYPEYKWNENKTYGTEGHRNAIEKYGITPYHRKSFKLLPDQLSFDF